MLWLTRVRLRGAMIRGLLGFPGLAVIFHRYILMSEHPVLEFLVRSQSLIAQLFRNSRGGYVTKYRVTGSAIDRRRVRFEVNVTMSTIPSPEVKDLEVTQAIVMLSQQHNFQLSDNFTHLAPPKRGSLKSQVELQQLWSSRRPKRSYKRIEPRRQKDVNKSGDLSFD